MTERRIDIAEQLRCFNEERLLEFGRGPRPDDALPLEPTMVGGDIYDFRQQPKPRPIS